MRATFLLVLLLALVPAAAAQPKLCHAENDGDLYTDNVIMGATLLGWQFTAPAALTVVRMETFTGEANGIGSIGIWTHDAAQGQPGTPLATGTWTMSPVNSWQGADLSAQVKLTPGNLYWVVWGNPGGAQAAVDPPQPGLGQPYMGSFDGGANWNGPFQFFDRHWKVRFYCDGCQFSPYGTGCVGSPGTVPELTGTGCPEPGGTVTIDIKQVAPNTTGLLLFGTGQGSAAVVPGCALQILPLVPLAIPVLIPAGGATLFAGTIPASTPVVDVQLQAFFADPAAPLGLSATNPMTMHVE